MINFLEQFVRPAEHDGIINRTSTYDIYNDLMSALAWKPEWQCLPLYFQGRMHVGQTVNLKRMVEFSACGTSEGGDNIVSADFRFPIDVMGFVVHRDDTGVGPGAADGSRFKAITLRGTANTGSNPDAHGIWLRARAELENVTAHHFTGNGIHVVAVANDPNSPNYGNANSFSLLRCKTQNNGKNGVFIDGPDVNAGYICLLYTSPSPRDGLLSRMPSSA